MKLALFLLLLAPTIADARLAPPATADDVHSDFDRRLQQLEHQSAVTLRDHLESRIVALEKATTIAAGAMETRLDSMNEFRAALKDQSTLFVTNESFVGYQERTNLDIRELLKARDVAEGKASQLSVIIATVLGAVGSVVSVIQLVRSRKAA